MKAGEYLNKNSRIIEFGAGQGRNSIALAEMGFVVLATDISTVGVNSINSFAKEHNLENLKATIADVTEEINGDYDLIVTTFTLHHLQNEEAIKFIDDMKSHTNNGGLNAITTFTRGGDFYQPDSAKTRFFPDKNELREMYSDWEILDYTEENSRARATKEDGSPMFNIRAALLARKPIQTI